jgi:hypothetical protein
MERSDRAGVWYLVLLRRPFLLRQLMLWPTIDTLLGDDVGAPVPAHDAPNMGAFARRAPARNIGTPAPTAGTPTIATSATAAREDGPLALAVRTARGLKCSYRPRPTRQPADLRESRDHRDSFGVGSFDPRRRRRARRVSVCRLAHHIDRARGVQIASDSMGSLARRTFLQTQRLMISCSAIATAGRSANRSC